MKNPPQVFFLWPLVVIACYYLGWSLLTGSVRVRGMKEPISRQNSPREYWHYMRIFLVIFAIMVALVGWVLF